MAHKTLLFLKDEPRHLASVVKEVLKNEDYSQVNTAAESLKLLEKDPAQVRLFALVKNLDWVAIGLYANGFDLTLAGAIASQSAADGWLLKKSGSLKKNELYKVQAGQIEKESQLMSAKKALEFLTAQGIAKKLSSLKVKEYVAREEVRAGKHEDVLIGFKRVQEKQRSEVEQALGPHEQDSSKHAQAYSLDQFLEHAIGHQKVRVIAKAQILEQLKRDGFNKNLEIIDPEPQGHYCEAFDAESYSFASNGPYVWLEWSCEEACEPHLAEEQAFPSCDLKFKLEKSGEV